MLVEISKIGVSVATHHYGKWKKKGGFEVAGCKWEKEALLWRGCRQDPGSNTERQYWPDTRTCALLKRALAQSGLTPKNSGKQIVKWDWQLSRTGEGSKSTSWDWNSNPVSISSNRPTRGGKRPLSDLPDILESGLVTLRRMKRQQRTDKERALKGPISSASQRNSWGRNEAVTSFAL